MRPDAWWRQLADGRVEIGCKGGEISLKISAPEDQAWRMVDLFEEMTGLTVAGEQRPARVKPQIEGQLSFAE